MSLIFNAPFNNHITSGEQADTQLTKFNYFGSEGYMRSTAANVLSTETVANTRGGVTPGNILKLDSNCWTLPNNESFKYTKNFSVSVWVKVSSTSGSFPQYILSESRVDFTMTGWGLRRDSDNGLFWTFSNGQCRVGTLTNNEWTNVIMTIDNNRTICAYWNGNLTSVATFIRDPTYAEDIGFGVGCFHYNGGNLYYTTNTAIADLRIYDECLCQKDIDEIAKDKLVVRYTFDRSAYNYVDNPSGEYSATNSTSSYLDFKGWNNICIPEPNSYWTTSFDAKANKSGNNILENFLYNNASGRQCDSSELWCNNEYIGKFSAADGNCNGRIPMSTEWKHYVIRRHFNSHSTALSKHLLFRLYGGTVYVKNVKLENNYNETVHWNDRQLYNIIEDLHHPVVYNQTWTNAPYTNCKNSTWDLIVRQELLPHQVRSVYGTSEVTSNYFRYTNPINFNLDMAKFTLSIWVCPHSNAKQHFLLGMFNNWTYNGIGIFRNVGESNYRVVIRVANSNNYCYKTIPIELDKWQLLTISWDGSNVKTYKNGQILESTSYVGNYIEMRDLTIYNSAYLNYPNSENEQCLISDFRLYATALSDEKIMQLYTTP